MDSNHTYLAVISLDSAPKKDENYYLQVFLKECKCIKEKVIRHITDDLENSSDSDESSVRLMIFKNGLLLKVVFLKNVFLREQY